MVKLQEMLTYKVFVRIYFTKSMLINLICIIRINISYNGGFNEKIYRYYNSITYIIIKL